MRLLDIANAIPGLKQLTGANDTEITSLCNDSRRVKPGALFFCIPGLRMDAHDFAPQAKEKGAAALVVERLLPIDLPQVLVEDCRIAIAYAADTFFGHPSRRLHMIGLTGTKGKTTTSFLVKSIFEAAGFKVGLIGTVCSMIGDESVPANLTTPDPIVTQTLLKSMADAGCEWVVMEVSAHAIDMHRLGGVHFDIGAFTNFSQDHLDYFNDMDAYFDAKLRFFTPETVDKIVYNVDDIRVAKGMESLGRECLKVAIREPSDVYANDIEIFERGTAFTMSWHKHFRSEVIIRLAGIFNVYNALIAAGIGIQAGLPEETIRTGLESIRGVPGRIELLETGTDYRVILDYAHSPDSLENILRTVRDTTKGRMIALFGCGGNRDAAKRPLMGEIAGRLSDYCILTSDNPRNEDPMQILDEIEAGTRATGCEYIVIENRREAIRYALTFARQGDVVVLAGKGHETYQEIKGVKHPFDEKIVVAELLDEIENKK